MHCLNRPDGFAHGGGVVGEIIHDGNTALLTPDFLAAFDAFKSLQGSGNDIERNLQMIGNGNVGQGVEQIVLTEKQGFKNAEAPAVFQHFKTCPGGIHRDGAQAPG